MIIEHRYREQNLVPVLNEPEFQLWRGEGAIKDYVCVGGPKRDATNDLLTKITQFHAQKTNKYSMNCLLVAGPGWGKSYIAKCLASHFDMNYLEFLYLRWQQLKISLIV